MVFYHEGEPEQPSKVELILGPPADPKIIRSSSAFSQTFQAKEWAGEGRQFSLKTEAFIPYEIWWPWRPVRICVSGHVNKVQKEWQRLSGAFR